MPQASTITPSMSSLTTMKHGTKCTSKKSPETTPAVYRFTIVLDCEVGTNKMGNIDYFSSETLIDNLVWPIVKTLHLNTRYSGVT
jgi:hypothetical protein